MALSCCAFRSNQAKQKRMTCSRPLVLGGDSSGIADHEFRVDDDFSADFALFAAITQYVVENNMSDLLAGNVHGGKRGGTEFRELDIVKPGNGNIAGNLKALLAQFAHYADGHKIVDAKNRGGAKARFEQFAGRLPAAVETIGACKDPRLGARRAAVHGFQKGLAAFADGRERGMMPNKGHPFMAQSIQITD